MRAIMARVAVVVPGILGSTLTYSDGFLVQQELWGKSFVTNYRHLIANASLLRWTGRPAEAAVLDYVLLSSKLPFLKRGVWLRTMAWLSASRQFGRSDGVITFPYDWRASLIDTAQRLARALQGRAQNALDVPPAEDDARFVFIAHSMGGLVVRIAVGLKLLHPAWIDRIVHIGTPLRGSPAAFRTAFGRGDLPLLSELIELVRGKHQETFFNNLRSAFQTFPSIYQLFPREEDPFLYYSHLERSNPLREGVLGPEEIGYAREAHHALDRADEIFGKEQTRIYLIFSDTHLLRRAELEYEVDIDHYGARYRIVHVHAASASGDGTVPAYSARSSAGHISRYPMISLDHAFMCNAPEVVALLQG